MIIFSYAMVTVFEAIISYIFISGKFAQKMSNMGLFLCFSLSAALQFIINTVGVEYSNIVAFLACNLLLCIFCFNTNVFQAIFTSILLTSITLITKMTLLFLVMVTFNIDIKGITENGMIFFLLSGSSQLFFFFIAYFVSKISVKENKENLKLNKTNMLFFLPMASILIICGMSYISLNYNLTNLHMFCLR